MCVRLSNRFASGSGLSSYALLAGRAIRSTALLCHSSWGYHHARACAHSSIFPSLGLPRCCPRGKTSSTRRVSFIPVRTTFYTQQGTQDIPSSRHNLIFYLLFQGFANAWFRDLKKGRAVITLFSRECFLCFFGKKQKFTYTQTTTGNRRCSVVHAGCSTQVLYR